MKPKRALNSDMEAEVEWREERDRRSDLSRCLQLTEPGGTLATEDWEDKKRQLTPTR